MKRVLKGERLNFFYMWQRIQLLHKAWPKSTVPVGERLMELSARHLNARQQYLVVRVLAPSLLLLAEALAGRRSLAREALRAYRLARSAVAHVDDYVRACGELGLATELRPALEASANEDGPEPEVVEVTLTASESLEVEDMRSLQAAGFKPAGHFGPRLIPPSVGNPTEKEVEKFEEVD